MRQAGRRVRPRAGRDALLGDESRPRLHHLRPLQLRHAIQQISVIFDTPRLNQNSPTLTVNFVRLKKLGKIPSGF